MDMYVEEQQEETNMTNEKDLMGSCLKLRMLSRRTEVQSFDDATLISMSKSDAFAV